MRRLVTACLCCTAPLGGGTAGHAQELVWPIDCVPGRSCEIGLPDIDPWTVTERRGDAVTDAGVLPLVLEILTDEASARTGR